MSKTKPPKINKIILLIIALILIVIGVLIIKSKNVKSLPQTGTAASPVVINRAFFKCDDKKTIDATFMSNQVVLKLSDGRDLTIPIAMSASGARYANADESFVFWNKGDTAFIQEGQQTSFSNCATSGSPAASPANTVSVRGEMVCLPHKNSQGPQTMECAYGLKAANGSYYELQDSDPMYKNISGAQMNKQVEVTGSITLKSDPKYDTIGTITVTSIKPQ